MAFDSRVYRVLIASPSDVGEEREIVVRVIQEWNDLHSYNRQVVLLPLRWETHTAPEYGSRPQAVINRQIVDQCDLLVGVFWTRIGSPTGEADSGTLEEIERVAKAGKPIMLYFSKIGVDPDSLDLAQVERLKTFKENVSQHSLHESYKSIVDFRDKFARQLELKVRDLQKTDDSGTSSLSLSFVSLETGELVGPDITRTVDVPEPTDLSKIKKSLEGEPKKSKGLDEAVERRTAMQAAVPVVLAIQNSSSQGIRSLFVEISIQTSSQDVYITDSIRSSYSDFLSGSFQILKPIFVSGKEWLVEQSKLESEVEKKLAHFEDEGDLREDDDGWHFSFEWGAMQPQRVRIIKPYVFAVAKESTTLNITARVFADSFPQPVVLTATMDIHCETRKLQLEELIPNLESLLSNEES